jgi:hypothetical protein
MDAAGIQQRRRASALSLGPRWYLNFPNANAGGDRSGGARGRGSDSLNIGLALAPTAVDVVAPVAASTG